MVLEHAPARELKTIGDAFLVSFAMSRNAVQCGSSLSAAHVSGIAALLLERNPRLTATEVSALLISTARPLPFLAPAALTEPNPKNARLERRGKSVSREGRRSGTYGVTGA